ncbi:hypothetical protein ABIA39_008908 [Nocardia sp. GAS34]|uniref:hypothetical protein n=1 Tax=unclassified Nocardia TaxID=2637762 RepID=UPI003D1D452F
MGKNPARLNQKQAKMGYRIGGVQWELDLSEEHLNPLGRPADRWGISSSYAPAKPTGKLRLKIGAHLNMGSPNTWEDEKRVPLERRIRRIVTEVKASSNEAERRAEEAHRQQLAQIAEMDRKQAEERRQWELAVATARPQAQAMVRRRTLIAAVRAWRDAQDLRDICRILDDPASSAHQKGDQDLAANLREWCAGGRALADRLDPTAGPASLGHVAFDIEPGPDDICPYLDGWSPDRPHQDYHRKSVEQLELSRPWPSDWELGRLLPQEETGIAPSASILQNAMSERGCR